MSVTTLPEALSEASRDFASNQQQLVIGGERQPAADGRTFETLDPATAERLAVFSLAYGREALQLTSSAMLAVLLPAVVATLVFPPLFGPVADRVL